MRTGDRVVSAAERLLRRREAAQENGSEGGFKRAEYYDPEVLSEWAAKGGQAVLAKYGRNYFVDLRKRRKIRRIDEIVRSELAAYEGFLVAARAVAAKLNGRRGGRARASLYSAEQRTDWARKGGIATRARYGNDYYREIRKLRKRYRKGYLTRKTKVRLKESFERLADEDSMLAPLWNFLAKKASTLTYPAGWLLDD
jgi:general stress protein YciG